MKRQFKDMNELVRLASKGKVTIKPDAPVVAEVVNLQPKNLPEKLPQENEGVSLLIKQSQSLSDKLRLMAAKLEQQEKIISDLKKELDSSIKSEKPIAEIEQKKNKYKFKIVRNQDGLIDEIQVCCDDEQSIAQDENKIFNMVKETLKRS